MRHSRAYRAGPRPASALPPPPGSICVSPPACPHLHALTVGSIIDPDEALAYLCPECDTQLDEEFGHLMRPCCGTAPGSRHLYNCPQAAGERTP